MVLNVHWRDKYMQNWLSETIVVEPVLETESSS
jgi:hypothetical protein